MGLDGQFADAQFRQSDRPAMRNALCGAFRKQERAHWCNVLEQHDICFSPVLSLSEAIEDEHMRERYIRDDNGAIRHRPAPRFSRTRSEEHTSELQSLMRISYAVFCLNKTNITA